MAIRRLRERQKLVLNKLTEYRSMALARKRGQDCGEDAQMWLLTIERTYKLLLAEAPEKARYMNRMFGLEHPVPRRKCAHERVAQLSRELCCSEATLYNWREEIVSLVLYGALETGLLTLYDTGKCGRGPKSAV